MRTVLRPAGRALLAGLLVAAVALPAAGHLVVFKDGFVLEGQVKREATAFVENGEMVLMPKGHFMLDDGPRRIVFSPVQATLVESKPPPPEEQFGGRRTVWVNPKKPPPLLEMVHSTPWNKQMERTVKFRTPYGVLTCPTQRVGLLTPSYVRLDIPGGPGSYQWASFYLTRELGPKVVRSLLANHPDLQESSRKLTSAARAQRRFRLCDFLAQAGWYDEAEQELARLLKDLPDQKERVDGARQTLARLRARVRFEEIKHLHHAGRYEAARRLMADYPEADATEPMLATLQELRSEYEQSDRRLRETARLLEAVRRQASGPLAEAAGVVASELDADGAGRLDAFLSQARQAERLRDTGKGPVLVPEQLLALAVTGWLHGAGAAEPRPESALRLWQARQAVQGYLRADDPADRKRALDVLNGLSRPEALLDEVAQMVPLLPPLEPLDAKPGVPVMREVTVNGHKTHYHLLLPPEYRPTRLWPLLIVLNHGGEPAQAMLAHWAEAAAAEGYVLAAPEWEQGISGQYDYTAREHAAVLDTLHDLRRRVQVDSDRVFLFGLDEGAEMAFDVGVAHPDLFAGVIAMSGGPAKYSRVCWRNAQYLPFYVVTGSMSGDFLRDVSHELDNWITRGFPSLWIHYKGRGLDWFGGELPMILDWMRPKRRAFPAQQLGSDGGGGAFGNEFCTMRHTDKHFYWLSADAINPRRINDPRDYKEGRSPATLTGRIDPSENLITLTITGVDRATVWLGRTAAGRTQVDFSRPLTVRANLQTMWANRKVSPSLAVLLEDLYERGDRQQLFVAKIPLRLR
jgi:pimeloyl-ACP methyl ester carboxylesterase